MMSTNTSKGHLNNYSGVEFDFFPDVSVLPGVSELEYSSQKAANSGIWFLHIKEGAALVLLVVDPTDKASGGRYFR